MYFWLNQARTKLEWDINILTDSCVDDAVLVYDIHLTLGGVHLVSILYESCCTKYLPNSDACSVLIDTLLEKDD